MPLHSELNDNDTDTDEESKGIPLRENTMIIEPEETDVFGSSNATLVNSEGPVASGTDLKPKTTVKKSNPCLGQPIIWEAGTVWSTYAFMQHDDEQFAFKPIGFIADHTVILQSKDCSQALLTPKEIETETCTPCSGLQKSIQLHRSKERALEAKPWTPYRWLTPKQMADLLQQNREGNKRLRSQVCLLPTQDCM